MASLDWSQWPAVENVHGKASGAWVLRGTRTVGAGFLWLAIIALPVTPPQRQPDGTL